MRVEGARRKLYRARQLNDGGCGSAVVQPSRAASVVAVRTIGGVVVKRERERERERNEQSSYPLE